LNSPETERTEIGAQVSGQEVLFDRRAERYAFNMATMVDIEKLALTLPEKERATLAANLL